MSEDALDVLMAAVLAQMSVISEQHGTSYDRDRVNGSKDGGVPHLDDKPMADYYRERYVKAHAWSSRRAVVLEAHRGLKVARRMELPEGQPPTIDHPLWKQWIADSDQSIHELARLFNVERNYIRRIRADYAR